MHWVVHHSKDHSIKYNEQKLCIKFAFRDSIEQDYLSKHVKIHSFLWNEKLAPQQSLYCNRSFSRLGTHFDDRPKILTYRQISPNNFLLTNCPVKITDSQAVSQEDLCTPDMNRVINWLQHLLRTMMLWEFFFLY